jgi:hypothetical protein
MSEVEEIKAAAGAYRRWALEARKKYIELRLRQDLEIRRLYIRAADRIAQELRKLALKTPSSYLRKRQLEELEAALRMEAEKFGGNLTKALETYIEEAVNAGAGYSQAVTLELFKKAGIDATGFRALFAMVNRQAVEACWARTKNGLFLSDRIWEKSEKFRVTMRDLIQEAVAIGQDAVKTARMLQQYVRQGAQTLARDYPNMMERMKGRVPGDICYEALRLARTEATAAFGEGTIAAARVSPSYKGMKWVLSHAHPVVDICDTLAAHDEGLGRGVYSSGNEPPMPAHPNCLCTLVPVHEEPEEFVERLKRWRDNPGSEPELERWYNNTYKKLAGVESGNVAEGNTFFRRLLRQIEEDLVNRKTEKAVVLADDGRVVFEKEGDESSVSFTPDELRLFEDKILTHNHPSGSSFSMADVNLATVWNLKGIRACGQYYRYYLNRPNNGWSREYWEKIIRPLAERYHNEVYQKFITAIRRGQITPEEANRRHWHEVWSRVAKETGLDYGREEW